MPKPHPPSASAVWPSVSDKARSALFFLNQIIMRATHIKGALLEYLVRNLLKSCGFSNVIADNFYSFKSRGLFFVNGKGAAHDADVIMNPPIQMPFTYPTQLLFECKAYGGKANLPILRNALGLRNDLNDFEIVTEEFLIERQKTQRTTFAIDNRTRFLYQVGVASVNGFTNSAIEFASNNKIPLLSLDWFLNSETISDFNSIDQPLIDDFGENASKNIYDFLKDRDGLLFDQKYTTAYQYLQADNVIAEIVTSGNATINYSFAGLLETGDMVFLFEKKRSQNNILSQRNGFNDLKAEIHWDIDRPNVWTLTVYNTNNPNLKTDFDFYVPSRIFSHWKQFNLDKVVALDIKQRFFSKVFVFNGKDNPEMPFSIINIDRKWLEEIKINLNRD